jgi:hypothetical protein
VWWFWLQDFYGAICGGNDNKNEYLIYFWLDTDMKAVIGYSQLINLIINTSLRLIQDWETLVEAGEARNPSHRKILSLLKQRRALAVEYNSDVFPRI